MTGKTSKVIQFKCILFFAVTAVKIKTDTDITVLNPAISPKAKGGQML